MPKQPYTRSHASCPYCKVKPVVKIWECSERINDVWYIRHFVCPYCGKQVELAMREYYNEDDVFQRNVDLRKPIEIEDSEIKKKQRIIKISLQ